MTRFAKREYTLELVTPAFLGGYDQSAEWRTAGIKALIRQWWRVVYVAEHGVNVAEHGVNVVGHGVNVAEMRKVEGERFGVAAGPKDSRKAAVQIRFTEEPKPQKANVSGIQGDQAQSLQYLGFGPFVQPNRPTSRTALSAGSKVKLVILLQGSTDAECQKLCNEIDQTMFLLHQFGTIGSRASNGWGSLFITGDLRQQDIQKYGRDIKQCLSEDWKAAIAKDDQGLMIWQTKECTTANDAMKLLKHMRKEDQNVLAKGKGQRGLINGPFKNQNRWPNQFVLKVVKSGEKFRGQVCLLAHDWHDQHTPKLAALLSSISASLDGVNTSFQRIKSA